MLNVLLGAGDGAFPTKVATNFRSGLVAAVDDWNDDGRLDLAGIVDNRAITILLGTGDGRVIVPPELTVSGSPSAFLRRVDYEGSGHPSTAVTLGDINGDGRVDLVTGGWTVGVMLGKGDGTFISPLNYPVGARSVALADIDNDGRLDVLASSIDRNSVVAMRRTCQ